ncbi:probable receptor-like protein kinase At5g20050 [Corylus avellana]|uniref:probable receptor-like protein kinase At5g20050 n=1 Tax=Corylus avellana TaxID=13451 RepID=UPI001E237914|nr:probable receptor-like protein kinase At5g20050 [Corylus avellana]
MERSAGRRSSDQKLQLLGYCCSPGMPRLLVYEFIPNGSLDCWIFPRRETQNRRGGCLSCESRYRVAIDVAKALSYLHHDCRSRVLHLDVKPENILLDENYKAIVADFGLSKQVVARPAWVWPDPAWVTRPTPGSWPRPAFNAFLLLHFNQ